MEPFNNSIDEIEELIKSCPRCGGASANKSNPAGRCRSCLDKLASNKKKPGHYLHNHKVADDAIRRQEGRNGTSPKKKSGHGTRKEIIKKVKEEEKKTGQVVSLDRRDNSKGYTSSNVRGVDPKLNRGRHKVDPKKLAAWKAKLKKSGLSVEDFITLLKIKAANDEVLQKSINLDELEYWLLYERSSPELLMKAIHEEEGNVHTVEVHPDIDHLYHMKSIINDSNKPNMHINEFKKMGISPKIIDKLPQDEKGRVTPEAIDEHIAGLPKQKVNIHVLPYNSIQQKHRVDSPEHVLSVNLHPEEKAKMDEKQQALWNTIKDRQHNWWGDEANNSNNDQIGWVRIDGNKAKDGDYEPHDHWHLDEIQSDFQNPKKISFASRKDTDETQTKLLETLSHGHEDPQHMLHSAVNALGRKLGVKSTSMDTPEDQARKSVLNQPVPPPAAIEPFREQIWQNSVKRPNVEYQSGWDHEAEQHARNSSNEERDAHWQNNRDKLLKEHIDEQPEMEDAIKNIGGMDNLKTLAQNTIGHDEGWAHKGSSSDEWGKNEDEYSEDDDAPYRQMPKDLSDKLKKLPDEQRDTISSFLLKHRGAFKKDLASQKGMPERPDNTNPFTDEYRPATQQDRDEHAARVERYNKDLEEYNKNKDKKRELPVHQINTYNKRPKKLGFKTVDKNDVLGEDENSGNVEMDNDIDEFADDPVMGQDGDAAQVQYSRLHKNLQKLYYFSKELKKNLKG